MKHILPLNQIKPTFQADAGCSCGCGHHHDHDEHETHHHEHHEHDNACSCGCGHHHEHDEHETHHHEHHEHDDACSCGCGHHHEHDEHETHHHEHHEHDDACSCGCGHHHDHDEHETLHHEHHEHDDACSCGCGHHHDHDEHETLHHEHHEHDDACSCGCGHHHDHDEHETHHHAHRQEAPRTPQFIFLLENLGCAHCAAKMEDKINELPDVTYATITYATKQLRISASADPQKLLPRLQEICSSIESQVKVIPPAADAQTPAKPSEEPKSFFQKNKDLLEITVGAVFFLGGIIVLKSSFSDTAALFLFIASYLLLGLDVLVEAARNIKSGQIFDENFLMGIATIGAFAIREYPEAVGVMLFYRIGEFFEEKAVEKSRGQIMDAIDLRPETVNRIDQNTIQNIPAAHAKIGDLLLIRPGDRIPLDGSIVEGKSRIDTSPITGEPVPVSVGTGDSITSGCINTSGQLKMRVEKPLSESMVTRILNSVENAAASKPKIDRFITRFSRIYTPCVVFGALAVAILPSLFTGNWNYWIYTALTFLVMSCPCALVLSVPLAFFSGIGVGSKQGILFKGGLSIEALSQVKAVVMDKTGTITKGNFELQKIVPTGTWTEEELLRICAACEQNSTHPIAHSIVSAAADKALVLETPTALEEIAGHGIKAQLSQGTILCGNRKLLEEHHISVPSQAETAAGAEVFLSVNGSFAGYLLISDTIKPDAAAAVSRLHSMKLHTVMLTGDAPDNASAVAQKTGIREVHARLLPQDKLDLLGSVRSNHGSVLFVGDGINDAPVLAGADVGAAMGNGADAAIEAADAVFMQTAVSTIPDAILIARSTNRIALQNVVFALAIKLFVMILGLFGFANMWMAVFADSGVAMLCVLNSIRVFKTRF